jgi:hypothetical protein
VLPLSDGLRARRFSIVYVSLIVANFAVWLFYPRASASTDSICSSSSLRSSSGSVAAAPLIGDEPTPQPPKSPGGLHGANRGPRRPPSSRFDPELAHELIDHRRPA